MRTRVFSNMGLQSGVMVSSRRVSRAYSKIWPSRLKSRTKYQEKRRAGRIRSGRCTIIYHEGSLRRGDVSQCVQGQGDFYIFVRMSQCCFARHDMLAILLPEVVVEVAHLTVEAFWLSGPSVATIAESAKSTPNRQAFEAIMNCSAPLCSIISTIRGDGAYWECVEL